MENVSSGESLSNSPLRGDKPSIYTLEVGGEGQQDGRKDVRWKGRSEGRSDGREGKEGDWWEGCLRGSRGRRPVREESREGLEEYVGWERKEALRGK